MTPHAVPPTRLAVVAGWVTLAVVVALLVAGGVRLARHGFTSSPPPPVTHSSSSSGHPR